MQHSDELEKVRAKIEELEEQVKGTNNEAVTTALQARLAALQEKEVLIMRGKQADELDELRSESNELKKQLERTTDQAERTAMRQREVLLTQGEQA